MGRSEPSGFVLFVSPCLCCRPCARTRALFLSETTLVSGLAHRFSDRFLVRSLFHRQNEKAWQTSLSTACPASVVIVAHISPGVPSTEPQSTPLSLERQHRFSNPRMVHCLWL